MASSPLVKDELEMCLITTSVCSTCVGHVHTHTDRTHAQTPRMCEQENKRTREQENMGTRERRARATESERERESARTRVCYLGLVCVGQTRDNKE